MQNQETIQVSKKSLVFTWKHWLDFSAIQKLEFSKENVKLLMYEFNIYREQLDVFLNNKINSSTNHISKQYYWLFFLLTEALTNDEGFNKYKTALIKLITDINWFIIENSSKITEITNYWKESVEKIIHKYWKNMAWPQ